MVVFVVLFYTLCATSADEGVSFKDQALISNISGGKKEAIDDFPSCK